jgi:C-terminal processing protease CtpA/Prc
MIRALLLWAMLAAVLPAAEPAGTRLLRQPDISRDQAAFVYAGDLWVAPRTGGTARRLTTTAEAESGPRFSPDGKWIAFTRAGDVFVMSAQGGSERRLTWHPLADRAVAWTPDGRNLLIHSDRLKHALTHTPHLFLLAVEGGLPAPLPIPRGAAGSFSPDGRRIAYGPNPEIALWLPWKRYRGGSLGYIAMYDLENNQYEELPRSQVNDVLPMWHGNAVYFASDRDGTMNLYRYDLAARRTARLTNYTEWDVKHPSLGPDAVIFENGGWLYTLDLEQQSVRQVPITVPLEALPGSDERVKWQQALDDAWRTYRDHAFYPVLQWEKVRPRYEELMNWAAHSSDAEYVLLEMLGEAGQSHIILSRGDPPPPDIGLLGADFRAENGFYRIVKICRGEEGNEKARGPLAASHLNVREGEYLIAVNGKRLPTSIEVCAAFQGLAGKEVKLTLNGAPSEAGAREVTVTTVPDERILRYHQWVRENRARVAEASEGRIGYIHVGNVGGGGVEAFRREWRAQRLKVAAMIVDARSNSGGGQADDIVDWMARKPTRLMYDRRGRVPIWDYYLDGPKVMITNDQAVSGGDELPYLYKRANVGPLVGTRTMGGMIGSGASYKITGGWGLVVPEFGFYVLGDDRWNPENYGVQPDHVVELKPYALTRGRDPQLERAIELAFEALKTYQKLPDPPPYRPAP